MTQPYETGSLDSSLNSNESLPVRALKCFGFDGKNVVIDLRLLGVVALIFFIAGLIVGWLLF